MRIHKAVYLNTLRWFLDSPARLSTAALAALLAYLFAGGAAHFALNGASVGLLDSPRALATAGDVVLLPLAWILGVGVLRREVSSGAIQLALLRPLERSSYVLSKWAALASLNLAFLVFCQAVLLARGALSLPAETLTPLFLAQDVQALALAAVLTCFSSLPFKTGELGSALLLAVALLLLGHYADVPGLDWLDAARDYGFRVLFPRVGAFSGPDGVDSLACLGFNAGVTVAALALGMAVLGRREFGYSQAGGGA